MPFSDAQLGAYRRWLLELTTIPTAAGREQRVVDWIRAWAGERDEIALSSDEHGNLTLAFRHAEPSESPLYLTAHLDHPAFVVVARDGAAIELEFRGGVMDAYFPRAGVIVHSELGEHRAVIDRRSDAEPEPYPVYHATLEDPDASVAIGDVGVWALPEAEVLPLTADGHEVEGGVLFTNACDDLAAVAAALGTMDAVGARFPEDGTDKAPDLRVLFTLAEEVGFIGAIGACLSGSVPDGARLICLENSRAFPHDSPIGGGPIVRVGDRVSVFTPELTASVAKVAEALATADDHPLDVERQPAPAFRWQRKLMPGGACEASVFCAHGYSATCVCLPLGNYHNMADLTAVQAGTNTTTPRVGREHVAMSDYFGMIELLAACATGEMGSKPSFRERLVRLWDERKGVLPGA